MLTRRESSPPPAQPPSTVTPFTATELNHATLHFDDNRGGDSGGVSACILGSAGAGVPRAEPMFAHGDGIYDNTMMGGLDDCDDCDEPGMGPSATRTLPVGPGSGAPFQPSSAFTGR